MERVVAEKDVVERDDKSENLDALEVEEVRVDPNRSPEVSRYDDNS